MDISLININDTINASDTISATNFLQDILNGISISSSLMSNSSYRNQIVRTPTYNISTNNIENLILNNTSNMSASDINTNINLVPLSFNSLFNITTDNSYADLSLPLSGESNNMFMNNTLDDIINRSFQDKHKYKKVISDKGKQSLLYETYDKEKHKKYNSTCPIFQCEFNNGDNITILPCKHIFLKDGIDRWLQDEKPVCPVCRYKLPSKEIKIDSLVTDITENPNNTDDPGNEAGNHDNDNTNNHHTDNIDSDNVDEQEMNTEENRTEMYRSMLYNMLYRVIETPVNNRINNTLNMVINNNMNTDLQEAILASIEHANTINNQGNDVSNN